MPTLTTEQQEEKIKSAIELIMEHVNAADKSILDYASICKESADDHLAFEEFKASIFSLRFIVGNRTIEYVPSLDNSEAGISMLKDLRRPLLTFKTRVNINDPFAMAWSYYQLELACNEIHRQLKEVIKEAKSHLSQIYKVSVRKIIESRDDDNYLPQYLNTLKQIRRVVVNNLPKDFAEPMLIATSMMLKLDNNTLTLNKFAESLKLILIKHSDYLSGCLALPNLTIRQAKIIHLAIIDIRDKNQAFDNFSHGLSKYKNNSKINEGLLSFAFVTHQLDNGIEELKSSELSNLKPQQPGLTKETNDTSNESVQELAGSSAEEDALTVLVPAPEESQEEDLVKDTVNREENAIAQVYEDELPHPTIESQQEEEEEEVKPWRYEPYIGKKFTPAMDAKAETSKQSIFYKIKFSGKQIDVLKAIFNLEDRKIQFNDLEELFSKGFKDFGGAVIKRGGSKRTLRINNVAIDTLDSNQRVTLKMHQIHGRDSQVMPKSYLVPIKKELVALGLNEEFFARVEASKCAEQVSSSKNKLYMQMQ